MPPTPSPIGRRGDHMPAPGIRYLLVSLDILRFRAPCDARVIPGTLRWAERVGHGTMAGRETPLGLSGTYHLAWRGFSSPAPMSLGRLRYLLIDISRLLCDLVVVLLVNND